MRAKKFPWLLLPLIAFLVLFIVLVIINITAIPFHDFDEAHRAEGARNMRQEGFFLSPLVGSPYYRSSAISFPYSQDQTKTLYAELSRPPLVFDLMALPSGLFGDVEWAYRLPSLLLALIAFGVLIISIYFLDKKKPNLPALAISLLSFMTAYDWWLSAQMAHLDTAISLFTILALFLLIVFANNKKKPFLLASGVSLALAILSKGQPAIIFLPPFFYLLLTKKISFKEAFLLALSSLVVLLPWVAAFDFRLGWGAWLKTYFGSYVASPVQTKIAASDPTQSAPIFWYLRWWFDSFRPGIFLFGAFLLLDLVKKNFSWQKAALLVYIAFGFGFFSYAKNKVWWYVLPIIPAVCTYLYLAVADYLKKKQSIFNLSFAIIVASLPLFLWRSNTVSLAYGLLMIGLVFLLLNWNLIENCKLKIGNLFFVLALVVSLGLFSLRFPAPSPTHWETKEVGQFFQTLPGSKCLWLEEDFPYEAILYYSKVGELDYLDKDQRLNPVCSNYLATDKEQGDLGLIYQAGEVRLYSLD